MSTISCIKMVNEQQDKKHGIEISQKQNVAYQIIVVFNRYLRKEEILTDRRRLNKIFSTILTVCQRTLFLPLFQRFSHNYRTKLLYENITPLMR